MHYSEVYPTRPSTLPPQVMISDHSGGVGIPLTISSLPGTVPFVSLVPGTMGPTTIPCTTPASVFPPSPPPVLASPLPHVFVTDHSEVSVPIPVRTSVNLAPTADLHAQSAGVAESKSAGTLLRGVSEPNLFSSRSESERADHEGPFQRKKQVHTDHRYASSSTPPRASQWLKRLVVCLICLLVLGLPLKIGIELWKAAYGDTNPSSQNIM